MTIEMRRRGLSGVIALAVLLGVAALGAFAWNDAGRRPVRDIAVSVPLPELPR